MTTHAKATSGAEPVFDPLRLLEPKGRRREPVQDEKRASR